MDTPGRGFKLGAPPETPIAGPQGPAIEWMRNDNGEDY